MKANLHRRLVKWGGISLVAMLITLVGWMIIGTGQPEDVNTVVPTLMILPKPEEPETLATTAEATVVQVAQADVLIQDNPPPTSTPALPTPTEIPTQANLQAEPEQPVVPQSAVANQVIIRFKTGTTPEERAAYIASLGGTVQQEIDALETVVVNVSADTSEASLAESDLVAESEPDYYVTALVEVPTSDVYYADQWSLPVINAPTAWLSLPDNPATVVVAVVDSGVCLDHPDLVGRINAGWDYVEDDAVPQDEFEHGCGVAGIIAANSDNALGIAGVAPNTQIMPLRVLDGDGLGTYSDVAAAIVYAADNGASIINLSLGGAYPSNVMENAINYATAQGAMVIAASGNTGQQSVLYPAAYADVVAVGSVDRDLERSSFTSYGPELDLLAPGRDIIMTTTSGGYGTNSGTSFAAPQVAGVAALEIAFGQSLVVDGDIVAVNVPETVSSTTTPSPTPTATPLADGDTSDSAGDEQVVKTQNVPAKLSTQLYELQVSWLADPQEATSLAATEVDVEIQDNQVKVMFVMEDEAAAQAVIDQLPAWGGSLIVDYERWVDAWLPIDQLTNAAAFSGVTWLQTPIPVYPLDKPITPAEQAVEALSGTYVSQGVAASQADDWHKAGYTGSGVKVAVLDYFAYYTSAQAAGELPSNITTYGTLDTSSAHGTAVAEIIYDMAPGVKLTFATPTSATQMASYIVTLAKAGNSIISSSIGYYSSEPGDGTGPVSNAVQKVRTTYGTLYVQAAGNQAQYNWNGQFTDSDGDGWHEFSTGVKYNKVGYLYQGYYFPLYLRWSDWPYTDQDYDIYVYYSTDNSNWQYLYGALGVQDGDDPPVENTYIYGYYSGYYAFAIKRYSGSDNSIVLDVMGHNANSFYFNHTDHSLVDPATSSYAFAVAALDATSPYSLMSYSSRGPSLGSGGSMATGNDQPRIAGYANVDTWSYGLGVFNGTSSAAPHVAGAAAVVLSAYPTYDADDLATFLEDRAVDMGDSGYDWTYGMGRLDLGAPPPPPNDDFADAEVISALPYTHSLANTYSATVETDDPAPSCGYNIGRNVWYQYTPTDDNLLALNTSGSGYDTVLSVWTGTHGSLTEVACNDDDDALVTSYLETVVDAGTTYYIMVGGWNGNYGSLSFAASSLKFTDCAAIADVSETECEALQTLYNDTGGDGWTDNSNWLFDFRAANWYGVTVTDGQVKQLDLHENNLIGGLPTELEDLSNLEDLILSGNQLSGGLPAALGDLINLQTLSLDDNQLSGSILTGFGNLTNLQTLSLNDNQLSGNIPVQLMYLSNLETLYLQNNALQGKVPTAIVNLVNLGNTTTDIGYNALYASGETATFLDSKDADWTTTQTIAPSDMQVVSKTTDSITLGWTAIPYTADSGYYEIGYGTVAGWPYATTATTADKSATGVTLSGLDSGTTYYFQIRAYTPAHDDQQNELWSDLSNLLTVQTAYGPFDAPTSLTVTGTSLYQINLSWTDNSDDESSFNVERSPNGTNSWTEIDYLPANQTTYSETGLACGTTYYYRVRGFRSGDTQYSDYSNVAGSATQACETPPGSTIGLYQDGVWRFRDSNDEGPPTLSFAFGPNESGWTGLIGDWDGDGADGVGVYQDGVWYLRNSADSGVREISLRFNPLGDDALPIVGDWNRDGIDTVGVYLDGVWALRNSNSQGDADILFRFGLDGDGWQPLAGDWNGDNRDTVGLYKNRVWYLYDDLVTVDRIRGFYFGPTNASGWEPIVGDWDKDGVDTIGLYQNGIWRLRNSNNEGTIDLGFHYIASESGWQPVAGYRGTVSGLSVLGLGSSWEPGEANDTATAEPVVTEEVIATETTQPETTEEAVVTEETAQPEATEEPTATEAPTATPVATEVVVPTAIPTAEPVVTEEVATEAPTEEAPVSETTDEPAG